MRTINKNTVLKRSTTTGRFVTKPLGKGKATKFAKVDGVATSSEPAKTLKTYSDRGLKGDALCSAIISSFTNRKGKMSRYDVTEGPLCYPGTSVLRNKAA